MRRRDLLGLAAGAMWGCDCDAPPGPRGSLSPDASTAGDWQELAFEPSADYPEPEHVALLPMKDAPLLIALHGRGEAGRGLTRGARGWRDDYHLDRARGRLAAPPLTREDFLGFVHEERLAQLNVSLAATPYKGLAVACPYTPVVPDRGLAGARPFAAFLTRVLVAAVGEPLGATPTRARTGIDGVSMGGRLALLVGFSHPEIFGAVGALQPAISEGEADFLADLAVRANERSPIALRLVSSDEDPFLGAVRALGEALTRRKLEHRVVVTPGPHDYAWNRGPGSYEMLLWHERVLRGLAPP